MRRTGKRLEESTGGKIDCVAGGTGTTIMLPGAQAQLRYMAAGMQEKLDYIASYDVLTGLANRLLFGERLAQHMQSAASAGHRLAVFLIDLERFRNINDSLGQPAGDALLIQVAEWLTHRRRCGHGGGPGAGNHRRRPHGGRQPQHRYPPGDARPRRHDRDRRFRDGLFRR